MKNNMNKQAFSLVEILVALIAVSCISAALAPVITRKLKNSGVTIANDSPIKHKDKCNAYSSDCTICYKDGCLTCVKDCADNQFKKITTCTCLDCTTITPNCLQCSETRCKKCQSGYGLAGGNCTLCAAGTYSDGTTECISSPKGYYVENTGQSNATPCAIGTYQDETGKTSCKTCVAGTYQDDEGKTSCKTCEIDYACSGGSNHIQCATNYGANAGSSVCSACPSYCADCQIPNTCLQCNFGFYLENNTCYVCNTGYSCDGTETKIYCTAGYYAPAGSSACIPCPDGSYSEAGASACNSCAAGTYAVAGSSNCIACGTTWSNCTTCTSNGCLACDTGYKVENGSCVSEIIRMQYSYTGSSSEQGTAGDKRLIFLTSSGTFTVGQAPQSAVTVFVVGAGGHGGIPNAWNRGTGGGGGYTTTQSMTFYNNQSYSVTIGQPVWHNNGGATTFGSISAEGGKLGGEYDKQGGNGGSGGGGWGVSGGSWCAQVSGGTNGGNGNGLGAGIGQGTTTCFGGTCYSRGGGGSCGTTTSNYGDGGMGVCGSGGDYYCNSTGGWGTQGVVIIESY